MIFGHDTIRPYTGSEGTYNDKGDWVAEAGEWGEPITCDAQHYSSGQASILTADGNNAVSYTYEVFMEPDVRSFEVGDRVLLSVGNSEAKEYAVKGFRRFTIVAKLWV